MRGGWAVWLVSAAGSLAAHLGLMSMLSGMTLPPAPPPLADLYVGDAASEAPLEVEAIEEATAPLEASTSETLEVAAASIESPPVSDAPVPALAEAVEPGETNATGGEEIAPRVPPVQGADEARVQAPLDAPVNLPTVAASPLTETDVQPPELVPGETAASPPLAEPPAEATDIDTAKVEPEVPDATQDAGVSQLADSDTSTPALEPAADSPLGTVEPTPGSGEVDPNLPPSTEAMPPATVKGETRQSAVAVPETPTTQTQGVTSLQTAEAPKPATVPDQSATGSVATGEAPAPVAVPAARQDLKEPVASAAAQPQDTSRPVEQEQQMAALPPISELPMTQRERVGRFANRGFDLGACGLMEIAGPDSDRPRLNGFVTSAAAIKDVGNDFRRSVGVEPLVAMRQVMEAQCPAVDFIGRLRRSRAPAITVSLESDTIRGSERLVGRLTRATLPYLLLFIVDDDGMVHNLTDDLLPDVDGQRFAAEIHPTAEGKNRNQLIVAVGSTEPIDEPSPLRDGEAAPFFARLQENAEATGARFSLGYATFRVE